MEQTSIPERLLQSVVDLAQDTLRVPGVTLSIPRFPDMAISAGTLAHDVVTVPVRYQGEDVGELTVSQRTPADQFSGPDLRLLDEIARQTGIAVHSIMLSHDLRQSRERIVTAREEERRRIRRDLHDGLGPALASLSLQVEIARDLITTDPARSSVLLDDVLAQTQESLLDIRRLVYDLRPPALDDLGLVGAVRAQVATWEQGGLTVVLDLPQDLPSLSAALEVAIFRIVQEALMNVVRHANATHATITIAIRDDRLHLTITDDGNGLPASYHPGVGMLSMGERAGELGGSCEIHTLPGGGVTVAASFALTGRLEGGQP
jgi:signal transduction histidine kinase